MRPPGPESPRPPLPHRLLSAVTQADGSQAAPWKRELTLHTKAWPPRVPCRAWGPGPGSGMIRCTNRPAAPASSSPPTRARSGHAGHTTRRPRGPRGLPGRPGCPLLALLPPATAPAATLPELAGRLPCPRPRTWPCVGRGGPPRSPCSGHRLSESLPRSLMVSGLHSAARAAWDHTQTVSRGSGAARPLPVSKGRRPGHAPAPQATWSRPAGSQSLPGPEPQDPRQPLPQTLLPLPGHAPPGPTCLASPGPQTPAPPAKDGWGRRRARRARSSAREAGGKVASAGGPGHRLQAQALGEGPTCRAPSELPGWAAALTALKQEPLRCGCHCVPALGGGWLRGRGRAPGRPHPLPWAPSTPRVPRATRARPRSQGPLLGH